MADIRERERQRERERDRDLNPSRAAPGHASTAQHDDGPANGGDPDLSPLHGRKRSADHLPAEPHVSRKGRACLACRKLKVKCDSLERGDAGCSRCQRLGLDCVTSKRLKLNLDDDGEISHPALVRLDRAVEDILSRLQMPPLDAYGVAVSSAPAPTAAPAVPPMRLQPGAVDSNAHSTRENSREPMAEDTAEVAAAPMGSLFEVTQLNSLRSRLKWGGPARRNSTKYMEMDLISTGVVTVQEAEEMFTLFKVTLARYLFDAIVQEARTLRSVRESSALFFTAIITVTSLHLPGREKVHAAAHKALRDLIATSFFDRSHTLDDIRALCIAAFWLPDLSWKLSGHCVRMATELNLHQAFFKALYSPKVAGSERDQAFERARLWYLIYVLDHHFSIAYGRPPATAELQAIQEYDSFLAAPQCTASDRRVISQVALFVILTKAYHHFGLEAERLMDGDDVTLLTHQRFIDHLDRWRNRFRHALHQDVHVGNYPVMGVELHYHFALMMLNSLALRGRSLLTIASTSTLPLSLRPLAGHAIDSAHQILVIVLEQPAIRDSMVGVPLYLHTVIAFAVVFLIKMSSRWKGIGVKIDAESKTKPLIEAIIALFRGCKAARSHILFSMADGFERLLHRNLGSGGHGSFVPAGAAGAVGRPGRVNGEPDKGPKLEISGYGLVPGSLPRPSAESYGPDRSPPPYTPTQTPAANAVGAPAVFSSSQPHGVTGYGGAGGGDPYSASPHSQPSAGAGSFAGWQTEDDMLWSMGMGYDLLAMAPDVNAHGLSGFAALWPMDSMDPSGELYPG